MSACCPSEARSYPHRSAGFLSTSAAHRTAIAAVVGSLEEGVLAEGLDTAGNSGEEPEEAGTAADIPATAGHMAADTAVDMARCNSLRLHLVSPWPKDVFATASLAICE